MSDKLTPALCRAARGMLNWSQTTLATRSGLSRQTIVDFEREARSPHPQSISALVETFNKHGVAFETEGRQAVVMNRDYIAIETGTQWLTSHTRCS